jgi:hypothetical protein
MPQPQIVSNCIMNHHSQFIVLLLMRKEGDELWCWPTNADEHKDDAEENMQILHHCDFPPTRISAPKNFDGRNKYSCGTLI